MSFDVSWIFRAKNEISPEAKAIARDVKKVRKEALAASGALNRKATAFRNVKAAALRAKRKLRAYRKETTANTFSTGALISKFKAFAAVALAGLGLSAIIREGAAFQSSMADLSAITGAAGDDLDNLKGRVKELALESRTMPTDVALAFKSVASAKPELLENQAALAGVTEQVLLLKNAAGIEMQQAVDTVTRGLNIFGEGADKAAEFVDILAAGAKFGSSEIAQTGEAALLAGGAAVDAGLNFREMNAAIQVVAKGGFVGARAGTALQAIFTRLTIAGFDFKKLGVDGVMSQVAKQLGKIKDPAERAAAKSKLFGLEHQKVAGALLRNIPLITEMNEKLKITGVAAEQARIRMGTFSSGIQGMKVQLAVISGVIFDKMLPGLNLMSAAGSEFLDSIDASDLEAIGLVLSGIGAALAGVGALIGLVFRVALVAIKPVLAIFKGIVDVLAQLVAALFSLDFSQFDISKSFDLGGSFLGLFGGDEEDKKAAADEAKRKSAEALKNIPAANDSTLNTPAVSPAVATANANASINGQIKVSASPGSNVDSIQSDNNFLGPQGNVGSGLAG